jgi:hypothetical protein
MAEAERRAGLDEGAFLQRQRRYAGDAGERRDGGQRDGEDEVDQVRPQQSDDDQPENERGEGEQHIHHLHGEQIDAPTGLAGEQADGAADQYGGSDGVERDREGDARTLE